MRRRSRRSSAGSATWRRVGLRRSTSAVGIAKQLVYCQRPALLLHTAAFYAELNHIASALPHASTAVSQPFGATSLYISPRLVLDQFREAPGSLHRSGAGSGAAALQPSLQRRHVA